MSVLDTIRNQASALGAELAKGAGRDEKRLAAIAGEMTAALASDEAKGYVGTAPVASVTAPGDDAAHWALVESPIWDPDGDYSIGDCVTFSGALYACKATGGVLNPSLDSTAWRVIAAWIAGLPYASSDRATYGGALYACSSGVTGATAPPLDPAHWSLATGEIVLPGDLRQAAIQQVAYWHRRRRELGLAAGGGAGGNWSGADGQDDLLPTVKRVLSHYRRAM